MHTLGTVVRAVVPPALNAHAVVLQTHKVYGGTAEQLKAYRVGITPPQNNWVEVEHAVYFQQVRR